ncbi:MAG: rhomboid family intramembrane serine protease [Bacteriovorax sp.]|jgi:membrane associated rhomboid family serine protease
MIGTKPASFIPRKQQGEKMLSTSFVPKIIAVNVVVFLLWNFYGIGNPNFLINNFLVSWTALSHGRIWTLITSVFSHNMLWHIFINMFVFLNFGLVVEKYLGPVRFILFYLVAGMTGSLIHSIVSNFILHQPELRALGASGAISGVVLFFALLYPREKLFLFGIVPIPALWAAILFVGMDAFGLINQTRGSVSAIGYGAHLGGALVGLAYFFIHTRR